jgi:excisionase family DNA binding protein
MIAPLDALTLDDSPWQQTRRPAFDLVWLTDDFAVRIDPPFPPCYSAAEADAQLAAMSALFLAYFGGGAAPGPAPDSNGPAGPLTVAEAAAALRLAPQTVYELVADGRLDSYRAGRAIRVPRAAVDAFMAGRGTRPLPLPDPAPSPPPPDPQPRRGKREPLFRHLRV